VSRLSARDYKKPSRSSLDLGRWREFGMGVFVGIVAASALFALSRHADKGSAAAPRPEPARHAGAPASDAAADPATAQAGANGAGRYDFYEMLPNFEVVVPEKERDVKRDLPTAKIDKPGVYVLQAGSYRNEADADRVSRQLSLQGINAQVQRVAVDADVWHRVRIGPIKDLDELNRIRKQLQSADVDAIVIRVGD